MPRLAFATIGDLLTQALLGGDFEIYRGLFALPNRITPRGDLSYVIQTEAELREDFALYHSNLTGRGVTDIFRQVIDFTVIYPNHVKVRVLTHIMVRAQRIVDPFETHFYLVEQPDGWRICEIESAGGHINWSLGRLEIKAGAFVAKQKGDPDDQA
ncbi:hypothetical protein GCM10010873_25370 [Cypionkella aquatica]|uniref:Uncharacterized protein n=1 Tax=Cypionkella aquatica TaxID=1756042 RepID=A0AA37TXA0_9RHOB|nr:hypothetical protein [Cypionkella aquatica]GLS87563.1 hypothetical protein GCM10010873_25370 [Cypionkella aquatica]